MDKKTLLLLLGLSLIVAGFTSCESVDDDRIPYAPVNIAFSTVGDWQVYGVAGALATRSFIKSERLPSGFPYTDLMQTGFGGVLLVGDFEGNPRAYDLACPVERDRNVRIFVDSEELVGECPKCHSTYDIFRLGNPLSGEAAEKKYALRRYAVSPAQSLYMIITN